MDETLMPYYTPTARIISRADPDFKSYQWLNLLAYNQRFNFSGVGNWLFGRHDMMIARAVAYNPKPKWIVRRIPARHWYSKSYRGVDE